ncbi:MAG: glycoside hydrolase family 19 protein [Roseovarius sp.]|nr:glycoside hydrolase family 19 protein [Roseovarius sp.]
MIDRALFFADIRRADSGVFGTSLSQAQVNGIETIFAVANGLHVTWVAYLLATAYHETARSMQPIKETVMPWHKDKNPSDAEVAARLDRAWAKGQMPQVKRAYWRADDRGRHWFGRGYVQLTHRSNYEKLAAVVGVDLVGDPNRALHPETAAKVLVEGCELGLFTGKKLSDYLPGDYVGARYIVNGSDRAKEIAECALAFQHALEESGYTAKAVTTDDEEPPAPASLWAWITALIRRIFGKGN